MQLEQEIDQKEFRSEYQKVIINLLYTGKWLDYRHNQLFKCYGLTTQQFNILRILRGCAPEPATIFYLTTRMLDKSSNASRLVDKLEEKHLLIRQICPANRRSVDVHISKAGLALLARIDEEVVMLDQEIARVLTHEQARTLNQALDAMRDIAPGPCAEQEGQPQINQDHPCED